MGFYVFKLNMCSACRAKQASRKADADSEKGKKRDKDGGGVRANGEDGGGAAVERREEKKSHDESK